MTSPAASSAGPVSGARPGPVVDQRLEDRVAVLTMQSAPHNVLDAALVEALLSGLGWAAEQEARAVVVRSGLRHFCAGADVGALRRSAEAGGGVMRRPAVEVLRAFAAVPVPVIASVHGVCVGGGLEVALACDLIVAAESAMIGSVEVMVGLHPLYLIAMHRMDLAADPRFRTPELRLANRDELHAIVQRWIWTFPDTAALGAQLDLAKVAIGELRGLKEFAATDWAAQWQAVRAVPDRNGGQIKVPGLPWRFRSPDGQDGVSTPEQMPAFQGEHNAEVLAELGYGPEEIAAFRDSGMLIAPGCPELS